MLTGPQDGGTIVCSVADLLEVEVAAECRRDIDDDQEAGFSADCTLRMILAQTTSGEAALEIARNMDARSVWLNKDELRQLYINIIATSDYLEAIGMAIQRHFPEEELEDLLTWAEPEGDLVKIQKELTEEEEKELADSVGDTQEETQEIPVVDSMDAFPNIEDDEDIDPRFSMTNVGAEEVGEAESSIIDVPEWCREGIAILEDAEKHGTIDKGGKDELLIWRRAMAMILRGKNTDDVYDDLQTRLALLAVDQRYAAKV